MTALGADAPGGVGPVVIMFAAAKPQQRDVRKGRGHVGMHWHVKIMVEVGAGSSGKTALPLTSEPHREFLT